MHSNKNFIIITYINIISKLKLQIDNYICIANFLLDIILYNNTIQCLYKNLEKHFVI